LNLRYFKDRVYADYEKEKEIIQRNFRNRLKFMENFWRSDPLTAFFWTWHGGNLMFWDLKYVRKRFNMLKMYCSWIFEAPTSLKRARPEKHLTWRACLTESNTWFPRNFLLKN